MVRPLLGVLAPVLGHLCRRIGIEHSTNEFEKSTKQQSAESTTTGRVVAASEDS